MADLVVDSSVVAKWLLPEADSHTALQLVSVSQMTSDRLVVLDLAFPEVASAIWKRHRQKLATLDEVRQFLDALLRSPVHVIPAVDLLPAAMELAIRFDRSIYDTLFVAAVQALGSKGITADAPLHRAVQSEFPTIALLGRS